MLGAATMSEPKASPAAPRAAGRPLEALLNKKRLKQFRNWLEVNGAEILAPTNEYELLRFRAKGATHVLYRNKNWSTVTCSTGETVHEAWTAHCTSQSWRAGPSQRARLRKKRDAHVDALLLRDGDECFFCGVELAGDMTIEHFVGRTHNGPNHMSNLALAHEDCNKKAGSLSVVDKFKLREEMRCPNSAWRDAQAAKARARAESEAASC